MLSTINKDDMAMFNKFRRYWSFKSLSDSPPWPTTDEGELERRAFLCNVSDISVEGDMTIRMLQAFGIPVTIKYERGNQPARAMWGFSAAGKNIYVPESMLNEAKELLNTSVELPGDFEGIGDVEDDI